MRAGVHAPVVHPGVLNRLMGRKRELAREMVNIKISVASMSRVSFFTLLFSGTGHMDSPGKYKKTN